MQTKATTSDASLCSRAEELRQANVPLQLVSGWLDSTAAAAINLYHYCGQAPGTSSFFEHLHQKLLMVRPVTRVSTPSQRLAQVCWSDSHKSLTDTCKQVVARATMSQAQS